MAIAGWIGAGAILAIVATFMSALPAQSGDPRVIEMGEQSAVVRQAPVSRRLAGDKRLVDGREARGERNIRAAWFSDPTDRYQLSAFVTAQHAASLTVVTSDRRVHKLTLPDDSVFEDREPRIWDVDGDGLDEVVVVRTYLKTGAVLAVVAVQGSEIRIALETPQVRRTGEWLNPLGIGDFDGDGKPDIALVREPHESGELQIWTLQGGRLVQKYSDGDVSTHVKGSVFTKLAVVADFNGDGVVDLAVPSRDRRMLRALTFKGGIRREISRTALPGPATEDFALTGSDGLTAVLVGLTNGRAVTVLP